MPGRRTRRRRGLTLLEVLAALAILAIGAAGWATLAGQGAHSVNLSQARATEIADASAQLAAVSMWPATRLNAATGRTRVGSFILIVAHPTPGLFEIAIADTLRGATVLHTTLYVRDSLARSP